MSNFTLPLVIHKYLITPRVLCFHIWRADTEQTSSLYESDCVQKQPSMHTQVHYCVAVMLMKGCVLFLFSCLLARLISQPQMTAPPLSNCNWLQPTALCSRIIGSFLIRDKALSLRAGLDLLSGSWTRVAVFFIICW